MHHPSTCHLLRPLRFLVIAVAMSAGFPFLAAGVFAPAPAKATVGAPHFALRLTHESLAQDSDDEDDNEVPPDQIEKYVAVYRDMQRDRSLTVETAAAKEGLTVSAFRHSDRRSSTTIRPSSALAANSKRPQAEPSFHFKSGAQELGMEQWLKTQTRREAPATHRAGGLWLSLLGDRTRECGFEAGYCVIGPAGGICCLVSTGRRLLRGGLSLLRGGFGGLRRRIRAACV